MRPASTPEPAELTGRADRGLHRSRPAAGGRCRGSGAHDRHRRDQRGVRGRRGRGRPGIARSNLFKCAVFGNDPNWGRVLSAVGTTAADFEPDQLDVAFNGVQVCRAGGIGEPRELVDLTGRRGLVSRRPARRRSRGDDLDHRSDL